MRETYPDTSKIHHSRLPPGSRVYAIGDVHGRVDLLQEVFSWARERGLQHLGLWAPVHRPAAISLYSRAGFRDTGERRQLTTNSSLWIVAMEAEL